MATCLNCGTPLNDKYCSHCGQKANVERLSWHGLAEETLHFFTHMEKGFFRTTAWAVTRPGRLFKEYLDGKRKDYHKPISFLLIWIGLFLLVFHTVSRFTHFETENTSTLLTNDAATSAIISKYRSLIEILILPFTAFFSWLCIARPKFYYIEILSINFYATAVLFILLVLQFIISFVFHLNFKTNLFDISTTAIYMCYIIYALFSFYGQYKIRHLFLRIIVATVINVIVYFALGKLIVQAIIKLHL